MTATPMWFGTEERPLFGWFHGPADGRARSGVVICRPSGAKYIQAHYALRLLAEQLAAAGFAALRFDYDGMGDSAGAASDPDRVDVWSGSILRAIAVMRDTGVPAVSLVGMRIGATLAAHVAAQVGAIDQLALWDPCVSGRSFLNEARAVSAFSFGMDVARADGGVDTPGLFCDADTARDLRTISLSTLGRPVARRALVLFRADRAVDSGFCDTLAVESVERDVAVGQTELMDRGSPYQELPYVAIARIASWISAGEPRDPVALRPPPPAGPKVVDRDEADRPVVERPLLVAPAGLFGMFTEPPRPSGGPTAIFLSVANEHHIGPSRLWVDLARRWARAGIPSLRLDLSGLGDSPTRHAGQRRFVARAPEAFDDVVDAARAVSPEDPSDVVLVGLCAGAYQAVEAALDLTPRGILLINPVLSFVPPEFAEGLPLDPRRRVALPRNALIQAFHDEGPLSPLRRRFPDLGWSVRLVAAGGRRPGSWIAKLGRADVDVLVVAGQREWRPIRAGSTRWTRERWTRAGKLRVEFVPDLEHGLLIHAQRDAVFGLLTDHALERYARSETVECEVVPLP